MRETAALMKLTPLLERKPLELSGGQQQRTALARAIVKQADLVLLDEPLANLDYKLREELREELPRIFSATGAIFVYATTEPVEALLLGGSTATLAQGRVTQFGPTVEVYRRPNSLETARIFSDPPINTLAVQEERRGRQLGRRAPEAAGVRPARRPSPTAPTRSASGRTTSTSRGPAPDAIGGQRHRRDRRDHRLGELHPRRFRRRALGGAGARRARPRRSASRSRSISIPRRFFVFDAFGALAAAPAVRQAA